MGSMKNVVFLDSEEHAILNVGRSSDDTCRYMLIAAEVVPSNLPTSYEAFFFSKTEKGKTLSELVSRVMEPIFAVIQTNVSQLNRRREQNRDARYVEVKFIGFHHLKLSFAGLFMGLAISFIFFIIELCSTQNGQIVISGHNHSGYDDCFL